MADGAVRLAEIAAKLKAAGEVGIRRAMVKQLRAAAKPLPGLAKQSAISRLPRAGGLNEWVATAPMRISVRTTLRSAGVRVYMPKTFRSGEHDVRATNAGYVRHPVFGKWVSGLPSQPLPGSRGWWDAAMEQGAPEARRQVEEVLAIVSAEIMRLGL